MATNRTLVIPGPLHAQGNISGESITLPAGAISDTHVATDAAIAASKLCHRIVKSHTTDGTAATVTIPIHIATAAGSVASLRIGSTVAAIGDSTVTADLKKNNATVLSGVTTLNAATGARGSESGTISTPAYVADDYFELVIVATVGTGTLPTDLFVEVAFDEDPV